MDDLNQQLNPHPKVTIEHENILMVQKKPIELPDITAQMLADFIKWGKPEIETQLAFSENMTRVGERRSAESVILVGRLALIGSEAFTFQARRLAYLEYNPTLGGIDDLRNEYQDFWKVIQESNYVPRIFYKRESEDPNFRGSWLGLLFSHPSGEAKTRQFPEEP